MNFAVILIKSSTEEVPRLLEKFSRLRFGRGSADRWSDGDLRVLGLRDWTAIIDPQLVLPGEREACQAISGAMGTDVVVALLETVSGTYAFGLYRKGVVVRELLDLGGDRGALTREAFRWRAAAGRHDCYRSHEPGGASGPPGIGDRSSW